MKTEKQVATLKELYYKNSKHSGYQILPSILSGIMGMDEIKPCNPRWEKERLEYIVSHMEAKGKQILDVGGNTGYFSFEMISAGAEYVDYYEGNKTHCEYVKLAAKVCSVDTKLLVHNGYYDFLGKNVQHYDIVLLMNVLHHFGDDYGDRNASLKTAKEEMLTQLNGMAQKADICVFQLGFNWKGNVKYPLFPNGTKKEMIDYVTYGTDGKWKIDHIGIATRKSGKILYTEPDSENMVRDDALGEFLNRPLFILKSSARHI